MVPLSAITALGVLLGAVVGLGLWLVVSAVPRVGRQRLVERVAPYVSDISAEARALLARRTADPTPVLGFVIGPIARPKFLMFVPDLPKTRSGKIMRRLLRDIAEGRVLGDTTTLADEGVVDTIREHSGSTEE